ncbi:MAG: RNA 3'-terminal phosphate cyclase (ATP) [Cognaticolwellia sp.]|jgi:RNA 3'-terminal phosphate cyclase (ATP)
MNKLVQIDGTQGEGGGQILRSALSLAAITGRPLQVDKVRGGRRKPGLMRQHLTCLRAVAQICGGSVQGAELRSSQFSFEPGAIRGGDYHFDVGSAGAVALVLQTVLPVLLHADAPSTVRITGGTHVSFSPSVHALRDSFVPVLRRMGAKVELQLERYGFNPAGGGSILVTLVPGALQPVEMLERPALSSVEVGVAMCGVPGHVGRRETIALCAALNLNPDLARIEKVESQGPGNALWMALLHGEHTTVFDAVGAKGRKAEQVSKTLVRRMQRWQHSGTPVDVFLADQLLLPLALAGGGSFRTPPLSEHARTNMAVIERFLDVTFEVLEESERATRVAVGAA